jgi:hypothetical protein
MSTTETVLVIAVVGVVAYIVMRQQDADRVASAPAPAPGPVMGRGKYDFFAELSEDVSGALVSLGGNVADVEKQKLAIEAAKAEAKKT